MANAWTCDWFYCVLFCKKQGFIPKYSMDHINLKTRKLYRYHTKGIWINQANGNILLKTLNYMGIILCVEIYSNNIVYTYQAYLSPCCLSDQYMYLVAPFYMATAVAWKNLPILLFAWDYQMFSNFVVTHTHTHTHVLYPNQVIFSQACGRPAMSLYTKPSVIQACVKPVQACSM